MDNGDGRMGIAQFREMLKQKPWPWEFEMLIPFPDVSAAFWRFLRKHRGSQVVKEAIVIPLDVLKLSIHIQRAPLTFGSERYTFTAESEEYKAQMGAGEVEFGSAAWGEHTRVQVYPWYTPRDPRFDQVPVRLRDDPRYLRALEQAQDRDAQRQKLQRILLSDLLARFANWILVDLRAFALRSDDANTQSTLKISMPPRPRNDEEWETVFDWYDEHGEPYRMTLEELAAMIGFAESTVRNKRSALGRVKRVRKRTN